MNDMTEEEKLMREEVAREVFGGEPATESVVAEPEQQEDVVEDTVVEDPWTGVNPALRQTLESLQSRIGDIDTLHTRLKQAESRIGGAERRLYEARQQAELRPTAEQVKKAEKDTEKWEALKEDFPEWAEALDNTRSELTAKTAELAGRIPDVEKLKGRIDQDIEAKVDQVRKEMAIEAVRAIHEDLDDIKISSQFKSWVYTQPKDVVEKLNSWKPADAIKVLNSYKKFLSEKPSPKSITQERQQRLESAAADNRKTNKPIKTKSLDDMTDDEYRAHVAKEIFKRKD